MKKQHSQNARVSGAGGAIYFYDISSCVLSKVCGYKCNTTNGNSCQFDYVYANDINNIYDSSIAYSSNSNNAWHTLGHERGRIIACSVNVSNNICSACPGISCWSPSSGSSGDPSCLISFSTFTNNTCHYDYICLYLSNDNYMEIVRCNVIRNEQKSTDYGTIYSYYGNLNIKYSCIIENSANRDFYADSGTITVTNCTCDNSAQTCGTVTFTNTPDSTFMNDLVHIQLSDCTLYSRTRACFTPFKCRNDLFYRISSRFL